MNTGWTRASRLVMNETMIAAHISRLTGLGSVKTFVGSESDAVTGFGGMGRRGPGRASAVAVATKVLRRKGMAYASISPRKQVVIGSLRPCEAWRSRARVGAGARRSPQGRSFPQAIAARPSVA